MVEYLDFDIQAAYNEVKERAEAAPVTSKDAWDEMVDDYITERLEVGELNKDDDTDNMIEDLKNMWAEYEKNLNIR
ncbi:MAG: hypothetical protein PHC97_01200 [Patescibacteria group bacterium]|nr:hypothetical protein [Patescibacteria group bacterium]